MEMTLAGQRHFLCLWEDEVVQNSAGARLGTTPTQLTLCSKGSASCVVLKDAYDDVSLITYLL